MQLAVDSSWFIDKGKWMKVFQREETVYGFSKVSRRGPIGKRSAR
jgi:hypothetical protein